MFAGNNFGAWLIKTKQNGVTESIAISNKNTKLFKFHSSYFNVEEVKSEHVNTIRNWHIFPPVSRNQGLILQKYGGAPNVFDRSDIPFSVSVRIARCKIKQVKLGIFSKNELRRTLTHTGWPSPIFHFLFYC